MAPVPSEWLQRLPREQVSARRARNRQISNAIWTEHDRTPCFEFAAFRAEVVKECRDFVDRWSIQ